MSYEIKNAFKPIKQIAKTAGQIGAEEAGRKLVKAPPKVLSRLHPEVRKYFGRKLGYQS